MFNERVGVATQCPEMSTDGALSDDVTAFTATCVEALGTAVIRVLDEHDAHLVHLLNVQPTTSSVNI